MGGTGTSPSQPDLTPLRQATGLVVGSFAAGFNRLLPVVRAMLLSALAFVVFPADPGVLIRGVRFHYTSLRRLPDARRGL